MCFPYCSDLGLATKVTCLTSGRSLWWSGHSFYIWGFVAGLQRLWLIIHVAADLIALLIVDSHLLHFQPNLLIFLCLGPSMYVGWCQMTPTSPKVTHYCEMREVRCRQVLVCLCGLHYLHGSSLSSESQFTHASVSIQRSSTNITPMTNTKFSLNPRY